MNNLTADDAHQHSTHLTARVFLAYAAADRPSTGGDKSDHATIAVSPVAATPVAATINALRQLLTEAQIEYWECHRPWPTIVDPESAVARATEACDNYLLVLTPRALADAICLQGLLFALSMNKRIVPVLAETVSANCLPEPLQTLENIDLRTPLTCPLLQSVEGRQLVKRLHHEANYHQTHTQLLVKALQWERQLRDPALLLRGEELAESQRWLAGATRRSHHQPLQLQALYVAESARQWGDRGDTVMQDAGWLKRWFE
ncbi:toll/interleukin-1 receptor domain-containing protein [Nodosilinea sp. LEGE 07298]|uniref:TIR domain-containing protein n=1 Tax=Nodosilinea sp. LEGE 07298 TaxID=2777970 RepID=UPI001881B398|nr:TIR domain-containing protein [Nodosilinea sp. LEGE 07298]MBE9113069.1 toll/interleukin-1 receptor domain-containing protein [Nodosilinea sp. LEGE 07298]